MFLCRLVDAIVSNKSSVVLCDDHALLDVQDDELERFALDLDLDPVVFGPSADDATILIAERAVTGQELDRGFALTGVATVNFGHWLLEYLPKVFGCVSAGPGSPRSRSSSIRKCRASTGKR